MTLAARHRVTASPRRLSGTPRALGYTFPAEWEPHEGTWFSWPRPEGISFPGRYHTVPGALARIIREVGQRERVHINVPNENYERIAREQLIAGGVARAWFAGQTKTGERPRWRGRVRFHYIRTNESWCRDHGPAFVMRERRVRRDAAIVDWGFNAWGGKYPPWDADDAVPTRIAEELGLPVFEPGIVMEGGAIDVNGSGTLLTTESCLLNKNRNPGMSKRRVEWYLKEYYGQSRVCWLGEGIAGDDTDGHVDDLARFLDARTIVVAVEEDPSDENFKVLRENVRRVRLLKDQDGRAFEVVTLPMPGVVEIEGQRCPATYLNFLFVNGAVLVPVFGHRNDRTALEVLRRFLGQHGVRREVVGIDCRDLIWGLGAIHCLTQQVPKF